MDDHPKRIADILEPIAPWLYQQVEWAVEQADDHVRRVHEREPEQGWYRTNLARCDLAMRLENDRPDGWGMMPTNHNGRIMLLDPNRGLSLRILHDSKLLTPPPGRGPRRGLYWQQRDPQFVGSDMLIGLWTADLEGTATMRVVRPVGKWRYGHDEKVDLAFYLPRDADGFASMGWESSDAGIEIKLPIDDTEEADTPAVQRDHDS